MSNLTGRLPYQKTGTSTKKKPNRPDADDKLRWPKVRALGCILRYFNIAGCDEGTTLHHIKTGGGGRKDHKRVVPLCPMHHTGREGIDGKKYGKRVWESVYVTEDAMEEKTQQLLGETPCSTL